MVPLSAFAFSECISDHHALDLVEANFVAPAVVELRHAHAGMVRHVMATSEGSNSGISGRNFEAGSRSRGSTANYHEISRPLIRKDELMSDVRTDEAFVIVRGARPLRCGRAIYVRRPEMAERVVTTRPPPSP
jgi:hypothetical protein